MANLHIYLNDKTIERLQPSERGRYIVRDAELKGFFLMVGARKKTFMAQGDLRENGRPSSTVRVAVGDTGELCTRRLDPSRKSICFRSAGGVHPKSPETATKLSTASNLAKAGEVVPAGVTLDVTGQNELIAHLFGLQQVNKA